MNNITFKEYVEYYADPKIKKEIRTIGIIGYVLAAINVIVAFIVSFWGMMIDVLLIAGFSMGIHVSKSRVCAILLCVYGGINFIIMTAQRGQPAGYLILILGISAVVQFNKAYKQYDMFKQSNNYNAQNDNTQSWGNYTYLPDNNPHVQPNGSYAQPNEPYVQQEPHFAHNNNSPQPDDEDFVL